MRVALAVLALAASCTDETTAFRTTDRGDGSERDGPGAAAYDVDVRGKPTAKVYVWSNGGYIGSSEEPMTHVGFEIRNLTTTPILFDSDALQLTLYDKRDGVLPRPAFTAITPLGPALWPVEPGATAKLEGHFMLYVRPLVVDRMTLGWSLRVGDVRFTATTSFTRDDLFPVYDPPARHAVPRS